jgi:hypothetical protein
MIEIRNSARLLRKPQQTVPVFGNFGRQDLERYGAAVSSDVS